MNRALRVTVQSTPIEDQPIFSLTQESTPAVAEKVASEDSKTEDDRPAMSTPSILNAYLLVFTLAATIFTAVRVAKRRKEHRSGEQAEHS